MNILHKIVNRIRSKSGFYALLEDMFFEFKMLRKYNGHFNMKRDKKKLEARIIIGSHGIEKGLSFSIPKKAFGIPKIEYLLNNLLYYKRYFKDNNFIIEHLAPIQKYIQFNSDSINKIQNIIEKFNRLIENVDLPNSLNGGIVNVERSEILNSVNIDYAKFVKARHSFRSFSRIPVEMSKINAALEIAQMAPSACNRQTWEIYIFQGIQKNELLELQQGCNGFGEEIDIAILITVDYRKYFITELHQPYVDGGLYAMCLIHALHSVGLGTIPLTMSGFTMNKKKILLEKWQIPLSEIPILIIGVGNIKESVNVAVSHRIDFKKILHIIG